MGFNVGLAVGFMDGLNVGSDVSAVGCSEVGAISNVAVS